MITETVVPVVNENGVVVGSGTYATWCPCGSLCTCSTLPDPTEKEGGDE